MFRPRDSANQGDLHKALTHPVRARILGELRRRGTCSPIGFTRITKDTYDEVGLNVASYHFRCLEKFGVIHVTDQIPRRGATEHVYSINPASPVPDLMRAADLMQTTTTGLSPAAEPTFAIGRSPVAVVPIEVDQQGREELNQLVIALTLGLKELGQECHKRLVDSGEEAISMRIGFAACQLDPDETPPPVAP